MTLLSRQVTIFEGPDGGGKSRAARDFANETRAVYHHFGHMPLISAGLARCYVEAMLPALLGYQDVVLDRCWLSEYPYGQVFRHGAQRMTRATRRMLDRLALRCGAAVVLCLPGVETCVSNFNSRRHEEMLTAEAQLRDIYEIYQTFKLSDLPTYLYNYTHHEVPPEKSMLLRQIRTRAHPVSLRTAGNLEAKVVLVGESFAAHKPNDPHYQWPFASFDQTGCSQWLTDELDTADISEDELMWVNADQLNKHSKFGVDQTIIALGGQAHRTLTHLGIDATMIEHPQFWKRFHAGEPYRLAETIKEHL